MAFFQQNEKIAVHTDKHTQLCMCTCCVYHLSDFYNVLRVTITKVFWQKNEFGNKMILTEIYN
jgi:hypothetical protein